MSQIGILGAGAFGTALAVAYAKAERKVTLWARTGAEDIEQTRENRARLPGIKFPDPLTVTSRIANLAGSDALLLALPMQSTGAFLAANGTSLTDAPLVACAKGIELGTGRGATSVINAHLPNVETALLTGPSFAADIGAGLPTALTLAARNEPLGQRLQDLLSTPTLRLYLTQDIIGAEFGGALKNVVAIAAGITEGAGLGESARAAVITRGFAELRRIAVASGAEEATLMGLSGLGDLTLTGTSARSRNYAAGLALGRGETPDPGATIEGIATAKAIQSRAREMGLDTPLAAVVTAVAEGQLRVQDAVAELLARPLKKEE